MPVRYRALSLMFLLTLITYLDRVCISMTAESMQTELGLDKIQMGQVFSAFNLGYVLCEIPGGRWADTLGARSLLARIVVWWSAFTALTGVAWSYASLLVMRFLFGCGEAGVFPGSTSAISRWFPAPERGRAQAVIMVGSRLGAAFAPAIVIALMAVTGWRPVYWIFAVVGVFWAAGWIKWYHDWPEDHPAVGKPELELIQASRVVSEHKGPPWGKLLRSRNVWMLCLAYSGYTWGLYFYLFWLPTYLREAREVTDAQLAFYAGLPLFVGAVANIGGGWLTDVLARRISLNWARRIPCIVGLIGGAIFITTASWTEDNQLGMLALAVSFGFADSILPVHWATCLDIGGAEAGVVSGTMNAIGQIGTVLAPTVMGWLVETTGSWELVLLVSAAYYVFSAGVWLTIKPDQPLFARKTPA